MLICELADIVIDMTIYRFEIKGKSAKARVLGSLLSPYLVQIILNLKHVLIPMKYVPSSIDGQNGSWHIDEKDLVVRMKVEKTISGGATAPDALIEWMAHVMIPKLIIHFVENILPPNIGEFFTFVDNHLNIGGNFNIKGDINEKVWEANLAGNSSNSNAARRLLNMVYLLPHIILYT